VTLRQAAQQLLALAVHSATRFATRNTSIIPDGYFLPLNIFYSVFSHPSKPELETSMYTDSGPNSVHSRLTFALVEAFYKQIKLLIFLNIDQSRSFIC